MAAMLTGIGLLALMFVWEKVWKPTLLDTTRDKLFDVRDNAREWFLVEGYGLSHPLYRDLREMLNCHLRYTERASVLNYLAYSIVRERNPEQDAALEKEIKDKFYTEDQKLYDYIENARTRAGEILLLHMTARSMFMSFLFSICAIFRIFYILIDEFADFIRKNIVSKQQASIAFASAIVWIITVLPGGLGSNIRVEKLSYSQPVAAKQLCIREQFQ